MKYRANYKRKGANPFSPLSSSQAQIVSVVMDMLDNSPIDEVRRMAEGATPLGYEFVEIKKATNT